MSCPDHQALRDRIASSAEVTDDDLLRYAEEVPSCPVCRRDLSLQLGVHPKILDRGGRDDLAPRVADRWLHRLRADLEPRRRWPLAAAATIAAAIALWALLPGPTASRGAPEPAPQGDEQPYAMPPTPMPAPPSPPPSPAPVQDAAAPASPSPVPNPVVADDAPATPPSTAPARAPGDAAANASDDDWAPPPFVDLRTSTPKAAVDGGPVELVITGPQGQRGVGDRVGFTVRSPTVQAVSLCVEGPEQGIVWRGTVPAGATSLAREGHTQRFAFGAAGTYRFALGSGGLGCDRPLFTHEVEVR